MAFVVLYVELAVTGNLGVVGDAGNDPARLRLSGAPDL
jgi:hypothetical protein